MSCRNDIKQKENARFFVGKSSNLPKPVLRSMISIILSFARDRMKTLWVNSDNLIVLKSRQVAFLNGSQEEHEQRTR